LPPDVLVEDVQHVLGDQVAVLFEREVAGVEQVELQRLQVALVGLGPLLREPDELRLIYPGLRRRTPRVRTRPAMVAATFGRRRA